MVLGTAFRRGFNRRFAYLTAGHRYTDKSDHSKFIWIWISVPFERLKPDSALNGDICRWISISGSCLGGAEKMIINPFQTASSPVGHYSPRQLTSYPTLTNRKNGSRNLQVRLSFRLRMSRCPLLYALLMWKGTRLLLQHLHFITSPCSIGYRFVRILTEILIILVVNHSLLLINGAPTSATSIMI